MSYKIECVITSISSDGKVLVKGTEGYYLKRNQKEHNVFWKYGSDKIYSIEETLRIDGKEKIFDILVQAVIHKKIVELDVSIQDNTRICIEQAYLK